jgi:two-component system LytT family sensor kinase
VMENSQLDFVPLAGEINILELYLGLEHFRFREKFEYTFTVDENIDKDAFEIPPMLIQPYIENAVWHGLRYKEEKGVLNVSFHLLENNQIKVIIEDDGVGRKKSAKLKTVNQKTGSSTGIKNTVNRIAIINDIYKKNIVITIEDLYPAKEDSGTRVTIVLPEKITKPIM